MAIVPLTFCSGVEQVQSAYYTLTNGALASQVLLRILPQIGQIPTDCNVVFSGGFASVPLRRCVVDFGSIQRNLRGQVVSLRLWDRRYWWQFGEVTGRYNIHLADGTIDDRNKRSLRELAQILLAEAGEENSDASVLPTDVYPEIEWSMVPPMFALEKMIARYGYELCWNPVFDLVHIQPDGVGADLPHTDDTANSSLDLDVNAAPEEIAIAAAEVLFQCKVKLEAVVPELDGSVSTWDAATYKPTSGWNYQQGTQFEDVASQFGDAQAALAKEGWGKWYRVKAFTDDSKNCPGYTDNPLPDMMHISPLNYLLSDAYTPAGSTVKRQKPCYVQGIFLPGSEGGIDPIENTEAKERLDVPFDLDRHAMIFKFSHPIVQKDGGKLIPAELYATISFGVTNQNTLMKERYVYRLPLDSARPVGPFTEEAEDIQWKIVSTYANDDPTESPDTTNNSGEVDAEAQAKAVAVSRRFSTGLGRVRVYRDIQPIATDGAIKQVMWMQSLKDGADTMAGRLTHFDVGSLRQPERGRIVDTAINKQDAGRKDIQRRRQRDELR